MVLDALGDVYLVIYLLSLVVQFPHYKWCYAFSYRARELYYSRYATYSIYNIVIAMTTIAAMLQFI